MSDLCGTGDEMLKKSLKLAAQLRLQNVTNDEMIVLGGLEEKKFSDSGKGLPLLSRIPVIKWFFSNRTKETSKSELLIFIKPTIIN